MTYWDVLAIPVRTFWSFLKNINRLRAEEDMRAIDVALAGNNPKHAEKMREALTEQLGKVSSGVEKPVDHSAGVNRLKSLMPKG